MELIMTYQANQNFMPWLFIGVGATNAYFTLRETYLHAVPGLGHQGNAVINGVYQGSYVVRSYHLVNLSQNADEAFAKASEYAEKLGYELRTKKETLLEEMREIQRLTSEEKIKKEKEQAELDAKWKAEYTERRLKIEQELRNKIISGKYVNGPFRDMEFAQATRGYITWLVNSIDEFAEDSLIKLTAELVKERCGDMVLPKPKANIYSGVIGKRQLFKAIVLRCIPFEGFYGRTYFTTMVDKETGACLMSKSGSFSANEGEELEFKATVKEHGDYKGQSQTVIQRISII